MKFFNLDSPIMQALTRLTDMVILNILFVICCLPIVTIGASVTALYSITLKMAKNEESYISSSFLRSFKANFRFSTISWMLLLTAGVLLWMDYRALSMMTFSNKGGLYAVLIAALILILFPAIYIFPYIARFENTLKNTLKNAFLMSIMQLPYTILFLLILAIVILVTLCVDIRVTSFLWIVIGFSGVAYLNSILFRRVFQKFEVQVGEW